MANAANVTPATASAPSPDRTTGSTPRSKGGTTRPPRSLIASPPHPSAPDLAKQYLAGDVDHWTRTVAVRQERVGHSDRRSIGLVRGCSDVHGNDHHGVDVVAHAVLGDVSRAGVEQP